MKYAVIPKAVLLLLWLTLATTGCTKLTEMTGMGASEEAMSEHEGDASHEGGSEHEGEGGSEHNGEGEHKGEGGPEHEGGSEHKGEGEHGHKIIVTNPIAKDVVSTESYVCQIRSRRHIEVRALEGGYLKKICVKEGQAVRKDACLFQIVPVLLDAKLKADVAEARLCEIEYNNTKKLFQQNVVAKPELALAEAKLQKALAKVKLAKAELDFTDVKAPFDGIVDRQMNQQGSLITEGDILTTLSDNKVMWAYFNVREARYIEYQKALNEEGEDSGLEIELMLANGEKFDQPGEINAVEADFDNTTGNVSFRADFDNPDSLLRNGQTGTIHVNRKLKDAIVIPQRATYEILAKLYVYVIDEDETVRQREIEIEKELEDVYVIKKGLKTSDKIIFEGVRGVRDGDKVKYELRDPAKILESLKYKAE